MKQKNTVGKIFACFQTVKLLLRLQWASMSRAAPLSIVWTRPEQAIDELSSMAFLPDRINKRVESNLREDLTNGRKFGLSV